MTMKKMNLFTIQYTRLSTDNKHIYKTKKNDLSKMSIYKINNGIMCP